MGHILENPWRRLWDWRRALHLFSDLRAGIQGLKEQKRIDELTQVYNRQAYNQDLPDLIREQLRYKQNFAIIMIDLDHFKGVNDTFGHLAGDVALNHVAQTLQSQLRAGDRVYRYGGEEFVVFMKNAEGPLRLSFSAGATLIDAAVVVGTAALQPYLKDGGWHPPHE